MRLRRTALIVLLMVLLRMDPASAAWSATAAGPAGGAADSLSPPTAVTATWDPVVHVSWAASASSWASGYRLSRSVNPAGPYTQVAEVAAPTLTVNDTPGAGTHYYVVHAFRGAWTSPLSNVFARADPRYVFTSAAGYVGTNCLAAGGGNRDMVQGWSTAGGIERFGNRTTGPVSFCTQPFSAGQSLAAGTTTLSGWVENTSGSQCTISANLLVNGATSLGGGSSTVQPTARRTFTLSFPTTADTFAAGDRLQLLISWQQVKACYDVPFFWGGTSSPSALTLTG